MYQYSQRRRNPEPKILGTRGFALGLNELTHPSTIRKNELAECFDAVFTQNGVVKKREGSKNLGSARSGDNSIIGLKAVYGISGVDYLLRIGNGGILQKYEEALDQWVDVTGSPTFTNKRTYILQAFGNVYFLNEGMTIRRWNGISWIQYNVLSNPSVAPTCEKQGTGTGPRTYYYKYVWFNEVGHTAASPAGSVANMPSQLDNNTWIKVTVPAAPSGATNVGIFRGLEPGAEFYLDSMPAAQTEYFDKGQKVVDRTYLFPTTNTTSGYRLKFATVFKDTLVGISVEEGDDTIVFSGAGKDFGNFGNFEGGGGFYMWRKGEGSKIVALHPFKEQLYVFKTDKIGVFDFVATSTGDAIVKDVNLAVGAVSQDAIHSAGNDMRGWGQFGAFSMGNEPNFADVIRTKVLSARIQRTVDLITYADIGKVASVYYKNLSIWALPTGPKETGNNIMAVYDERYAAWSVWKGMKASCFTKFIDKNNIEKLFYGDNKSGNVVEMFQGYNDNGNAIDFRITTKQFDADVPFKYKTFSRIYLLFGNISGRGTKISLVYDGLPTNISYDIFGVVSHQGFGINQWGTTQFGRTTIDRKREASGLVVKYADLGMKDLFSVQLMLQNAGTDDQVEFMGVFFEYSFSDRPLSTAKRLQRSS